MAITPTRPEDKGKGKVPIRGTQRIRGFTTMRYINRVFTYLLTYLLTVLFFFSFLSFFLILYGAPAMSLT